MNLAKRDALIERCGALEHYRGGAAPEVMPLVSIEEFFSGSEGDSGLLCNTPGGPAESDVIGFLKGLRNRPEVHEVHIAITDCGDDEWPFSDKIVVTTSASNEEVLSWIPDDLRPDEIYDDKDRSLAAEATAVPDGMQRIWLWYD